MIPNREGTFNAYPASIGVDETGPNKLATVMIGYRLFEERQADGSWADCSHDGFEITGYHYLEKTSGDINTYTIEALKEAFGWDGRDPFWLQETDLSQHPVQVVLGFEEYQGKNRIKVRFLNPYGSEGSGGVSKADDDTKRAIANRLGSKLRAVAGGTPAPAPKPATPRPAATPAKSAAKPPKTPKPSAPAPQAGEATMEAAWSAYSAAIASGEQTATWPQAQIESEWFRILAEMFPGKQPEQLSPAEWGVVVSEAPAKILPF